MTGPEHYLEAERLAAKIDKTSLKPEEFWVVHLAQVHATLALVSATALNGDWATWHEVAGPKRAGGAP